MRAGTLEKAHIYCGGRRLEPSPINIKEDIKMSKYEVWVTIWSEEHKKQIKVVAGEFDRYMNAKLFAEAYGAHYSTSAEIVEYTRK